MNYLKTLISEVYAIVRGLSQSSGVYFLLAVYFGCIALTAWLVVIDNLIKGN